MSALQPARKTRNSMSTCNPTPDNGSRRMWTERDDDLPAFMADMLATAIAAELLETTKPTGSTAAVERFDGVDVLRRRNALRTCLTLFRGHRSA